MAPPGVGLTTVLLSAVAVITASVCWAAVEFARTKAGVTKKRMGYEHKQALKQMKHKRQHVEEVFKTDKAEAETLDEVTIVVSDRAASSNDAEADDDRLEQLRKQSAEKVRDRLDDHIEFYESADGTPDEEDRPTHSNESLPFP